MPGKKSTRRPLSDDEAVSHNLSRILRHSATKEGLEIRSDGFVKVADLLRLPRFNSLDFMTLERIVKENDKKRYTLSCETDGSQTGGVWWIRANQGHSLPNVEIKMIDITDLSQIRMAVHGTTKAAWERISVEGLSRMGRHHVHFAQGLVGSGIVSGMRSSSQVLIFLNVQLALEAGLKLMISANDVVLCPGDERGFIAPQFFERVVWAGNRQPLPGWENRPRTPTPERSTSANTAAGTA